MKRRILHVFHVGADLVTIKHALNTITGLASWWTKDVTGSAVTDGIIQFRFADVFKPDMQVMQSNDSLIQWKCVAGEKDWLGDLFSFAFLAKNKSVTITFTQEYANDISDEQFGTFNFNWGYYLHSLKLYCETGKGTPWYNKQPS